MSHDSILLLGIKISDVSVDYILEEIEKWLKSPLRKYRIFTPNPEIIVRSYSDPSFQKILNSADLAIPDGSGLIWASKILKKSLKNKISGVDLMLKLCGLCAKEGFSIGLIGGRSGVALKASECLQKMYPKLKIVLAASEWQTYPQLATDAEVDSQGSAFVRSQQVYCRSVYRNFGSTSDSVSEKALGFSQSHRRTENEVSQNLVACPPKMSGIPNAPATRNFILPVGEVIDILFVAFGAPKQERWINENLERIPVRVAMGVGGAFDYLSGQVPRAPKFMRDYGLEWLFRLMVQPWRIKRQIVGGKFFLLVLKEWFTLFVRRTTSWYNGGG